jgi:ubiquinone/menaquinone biosynthesis C-methylase UbiE
VITDNDLAWDCACGTGQATSELAKIFKNVVATDIDSNQLSSCLQLNNVNYEQCGEFNAFLKDESVDFISVATGIHWLDTAKFYKEADRVLKKGGVLGVWGYTGVNVHPDIDPVFKAIVEEYLMPFYPESIKIALNGYVDVKLPFEAIKSTNYEVEKVWDFTEFKNYILSFTAMQNYKALIGKCGFYRFEDQLLDAWGGDKTIKKTLKWEVITKFSRKQL